MGWICSQQVPHSRALHITTNSKPKILFVVGSGCKVHRTKPYRIQKEDLGLARPLKKGFGFHASEQVHVRWPVEAPTHAHLRTTLSINRKYLEFQSTPNSEN